MSYLYLSLLKILPPNESEKLKKEQKEWLTKIRKQAFLEDKKDHRSEEEKYLLGSLTGVSGLSNLAFIYASRIGVFFVNYKDFLEPFLFFD